MQRDTSRACLTADWYGRGRGGNGAGRMECSNCLYVDLKETFLGLKHVKRQRGREGGGFRFVTIKINLTPLLGSATLWWIPSAHWQSIGSRFSIVPPSLTLYCWRSLIRLCFFWKLCDFPPPPPTQKEKFPPPGLWIKKKSLMPQWS